MPRGRKPTPPKPVPITAAKNIAHVYGYDQVVVIARKVGEPSTEHVVTYGVSRAHCRVAEKIGDFLKHKIMRWPEGDNDEN